MAVCANELSGRDWLRSSFSIWRDFPRDGNRKTHPASFPVALVEKILSCYARADALVLDPFAGSGSTLLAATSTGMHSIGLDINPQYRDIFERRLGLFDAGGEYKVWRYEVCDARDRSKFLNIVAEKSVDICITSPPYWDILNRRRSSDGKTPIVYSDSALDIANISAYEEFLSALGEVIEHVAMALKPHAYLVLNVMDLRKGSRFYALHQDAANMATQDGALVLYDIII